MRLLIISTLDSKEPFGAFTRPFYLGLYLAQHFEVCQLGLDCSAVDYATSVSINSRGLSAYIKSIRQCITEFQPDVIYAQETLPGIATLLTCNLGLRKQPALVFDFHTLSAFEYWSRLASSSHKFREIKQLVKTYLAQGLLALSGKPIIAAGTPVVQGIKDWYRVSHPRIHCVGNGVADDLLTFSGTQDPYEKLRPAKVAVVVAPKTFQFPTNDMSVAMTLSVAKQLEAHHPRLHFVVIGRDAEDIKEPLPSNVSCTGFLPSRSDFLAHLHFADVGLLPFSKEAVAGGARNKALDYLACKQLVISTPEGMRGLDAFHDQQHLLVSNDSAQDMARILLEAYQQIEHYRPLITASSQLIEKEYSWSAMAEKVAVVLTQAKDATH
ncbi:MAG: glycosyltransferase family 4 protein [Thermosynechococcaceae cyanobacterium]